MTEIIAPLLSFAISLLIIPAVVQFYLKKGWVDDPEKESHIKKTHRKPVPRGGGIPIIVSFIICALIFLTVDGYLIAIASAALLLAAVGVFDDVLDIHPYWRLAAGLAAGLIVVGSGIGIAYVSHPFNEGVLHLDAVRLNFQLFGRVRSIWIIADLFALLFILWNMNIVNWSKGLDGQLPAFVVVAFIFLGLLSDSFSADPTQFNNAVMSYILAGSFAGLLVFNWYPQKIMPGYGAGSLAGFFLSVLAILSGAKVATTLMVLAIPTADAIYTIIRRLSSGKSPIWGDRGHLHHLLLDQLGWGRRRVAVFYALTSLIMGILSLYLNTTGKIAALLLSFLLVFFFQIWAKIQTKQSSSQS